MILNLDAETRTETFFDVPDDLLYLFSLVENKNKDNYRLRPEVEKYLCYSVTYLGDDPIMASCAIHRPYFGSAVRVASKYCLHPDLNRWIIKGSKWGKGMVDTMRLDSIDHIQQQCEVAEMYMFLKFFISQVENVKGKRMQKMCNVMNDHTDWNWKVSAEPQLVYPNPEDPSCWQYVISNNEIKFGEENEFYQPW